MTFLFAAAGCFVDHTGIAVGNPGDADAKARVVDPEVVLDRVEIPVDTLETTGCDGEERTIEVRRTLDGLDVSDDAIEVPGGSFCALALILDGPVVVDGETDAGTLFTVELDVAAIAVDGQVDVDGQHLLFELPLPLEAAVLDALGSEVSMRPDDPEALGWAEQAADGARLWDDADRDGVLSADDVPLPLDGSDVAALGQDAEASSKDCGCATSSPPAWPWLVLLWARRQRRGRRRLLRARAPEPRGAGAEASARTR